MLEATTHELAGQAVGLLALVFCVAAFASRSDDRLLAILILGNIAFAIQFALFGSWVASGVSAVIILRILLARRMPGSWTGMLATFAVTGTVAAVTWATPMDAFPLAAGLIGTYAMFMLRGIPMRLALAAAGLCWIATNLLIGSVGALAAEAFILAANLLTITRIARGQATQNG
ncbi:YgjV family protein [Devosia sp. A449]